MEYKTIMDTKYLYHYFDKRTGPFKSLTAISKEEAQQSELEELMDKKFEGSLPAFIAAFGRRQSLSEEDIEEIRRIIER